MSEGFPDSVSPCPGRVRALMLLALLTSGGVALAATPGAGLGELDVKAAPFGAKGDGSSDDTAALQRAIDAARGTRGTVFLPDGIYMVDALRHASGGNHGLELRGRMTLKLAPRAIIRAFPNGADKYAILSIDSVSDVTVRGGTIEGDRRRHTGTTGEWGMGISMRRSKSVTIEAVTARDCWGDGFYVGGGCSEVLLAGVTADGNRRQGLSITSVNGMAIKDSTFKNTSGTLPEAGIDVEPNKGEMVINLKISNCRFSNNAGGGLQIGAADSDLGSAFVSDVIVENCMITENGVNSVDRSVRDGIRVSNSNRVKIINNTISDNTGRGILLRDGARKIQVSGNKIYGTRRIPGQDYWSGGGIYLAGCRESHVSSNSLAGNAKDEIVATSNRPDVVVQDNALGAK